MSSSSWPALPRLVIAGCGGDAGKTLTTLGLAAAFRRRGKRVQAFKKGPDYIDAAWLTLASGTPARNLDTYLMGFDAVRESFLRQSREADCSLVEGNRGLYDGSDAAGTHSTAELAKLLQAPVILVLDVTKTTRTAAALVLGCKLLDPDVRLAGVILNRTAGSRHQRVARQAIEEACGIPVVGALPRWETADLPGRHLGLVTPREHPDPEALGARLAQFLEEHVDLDRLWAIAGEAGPLEHPAPAALPAAPSGEPVPLAWFDDSAFSFYYPDNLEALQAAGARLIPVNSLSDTSLPAVQGLYIGGGFPETHAARLAANAPLLRAVREAAGDGLPIYAECGGLIYLSRSLAWQDRTHALAGVFPLDLAMFDRPQGHGYMEVRVESPNPWFPAGRRLKGHEFHYTRVAAAGGEVPTLYAVERGSGCFPGRDGLRFKNTLASYLHLHALGVPEWAANFVALARAAAR
ncbi:MAG: cobyrinate a,c-diamide synthase [Candidatus Zixiibacteriota bacterium]|nr:MAG: cobyrinate a,c-diamide synthase [candidate division Zixibacteria bacterium]